MEQAIRPLGGHAVYLLMLQLALLLLVARLGSEGAKRLGLPAVIGELASGIVLGPSFFGSYYPHAFAAVFPTDQAQYHLLDVVGNLGMVFLLLLTGLETDLRLLKNVGRAALIASTTGMLVPFASGFVLGMLIPSTYISQPDHRILFSLFLATTMAISAMPVIAKILMDLDLTKRNIGLVILSAGVVDDTAGWLVLSLIAGAASQGMVRVGDLAWTIVYLAAFLAIVGIVMFPISRWLMKVSTRTARSRDTDLVLIVVVAFLCAAATEKIGVHAVFGAFVAGTMLKQTRIREETVHRLEGFVFAILAPVFFGIVGLHVDLWSLGGGSMLGIVLAVACVGKLVGCSVGALWGGLRFWEAMTIAVAMNARGAMGLVVATIGLSLGLLNQQMFSIIVVMAIVTSFMAPLGIRLTIRRVRMTDEEAKRIEAAEAKGSFDPEHVRILIPTAGGKNTLGAAQLAFGIARRSESQVEVLHVAAVTKLADRLRRLLVRDPVRQGLDEHIEAMKDLANGSRPPNVRRVVSREVSTTIVDEAQKGYDIILMGASERRSSVIEDVVDRAPCHVAITMMVGDRPTFERLLVPIDGGVVSRVAVEFAVRFAESTGASLTLALLSERQAATSYITDAGDSIPVGSPNPSHPDPEAELERISRIFRASDLRPTIVRLGYDPMHGAINDEVATGKYDLVVLGAENRAIQHRLFFGYEKERLIRKSPISIAIVVPNLAKLS